MKQRFDGGGYGHDRDGPRLTKQYQRVFDLMKDGVERTLYEISANTGDPEASVSAQLRHMRKPRFGEHTIDKRYVDRGLYLYRLTVNTPDPVQQKMEL